MRNVIVNLDINNNAGRQILGGILRFTAERNHWSIQLLTGKNQLTAKTIRQAPSHDVDGFLVNNTEADKVAWALAETPLPVAAIVASTERMDTPIATRRRLTALVGNDNHLTGVLCARHLLSLGRFHSFGFAGHPHNPDWSEARRDGFVSELRRHGFKAIDLADKWLPDQLSRSDCPIGVMAASDFDALRLLERINRSTLSIPEDIAVIGADGDPLVCDNTTPSLTSIRLDFENIGYHAAEALDRLMNGQGAERVAELAYPPVGLVERASTRPLPPAEMLVQRAKALIAREAVNGLTAHDLAVQLGVSPRLLLLRFRQFESISVREAILRTRLEAVRQRLAENPRIRRDALAAACGFASANRLAHLFKERYGKPPGQFS